MRLHRSPPAFLPLPPVLSQTFCVPKHPSMRETAQMWNPSHRQLLTLPSDSGNERRRLNLTLLLLPAFAGKSESPGAVELLPAGTGQQP